MIPSVVKTFDKLKELHIRKNADYTGKSKNRFYNFRIASFFTRIFDNNEDKVYATIIGIKFGRLSALLNSKNCPQNEPVLDSFDDAIVYLAIWKADVERRLTEVSNEEK